MGPQLNLPPANLRIQNNYVWDILRKKRLLLTPEEWVRQHFIHFLINHQAFPAGLMVSEYSMVYAGKKVRADIVVFNENAQPHVVIECKAPKIKISEETFYQTAKYIAILRPQFFIMTNGMHHYCAEIKASGELIFLPEIPNYQGLI